MSQSDSQQQRQPQPTIHPDSAPDHEPDYQPLVQLTEVETKTHEENETVFFKLRAKLFRFDKPSSEWKERGTGEVKLLQDKTTNKIRLVMRRDKTLKVCANHFISPDMVLAPNIASDRSWVYNATADMGDEGTVTAETLAIRFGNSDNANAFKAKFEEAQKINAGLLNQDPSTSNGVEGGSAKKEGVTEVAKVEEEEEDEKKDSTSTDDKVASVQPAVQSDATADVVASTKDDPPSTAGAKTEEGADKTA